MKGLNFGRNKDKNVIVYFEEKKRNLLLNERDLQAMLHRDPGEV